MRRPGGAAGARALPEGPLPLMSALGYDPWPWTCALLLCSWLAGVHAGAALDPTCSGSYVSFQLLGFTTSRWLWLQRPGSALLSGSWPVRVARHRCIPSAAASPTRLVAQPRLPPRLALPPAGYVARSSGDIRCPCIGTFGRCLDFLLSKVYLGGLGLLRHKAREKSLIGLPVLAATTPAVVVPFLKALPWFSSLPLFEHHGRP